jgi:hypothetical protein
VRFIWGRLIPNKETLLIQKSRGFYTDGIMEG